MPRNKAEPQKTAKNRKARQMFGKIAMRSMLMNAEIEVIRRYVETVSSSFQRELKEYEAYISKQAENAHEDDLQSLGEDWGEAQGFFGDLFPAFALKTTFVSVYSLVEDEMTALAEVVGTYLGIALKPSELKDKGIFAAKKHLKTLSGIAFPEETHPWQELMHYNRIRNAIVHVRGRVSRSRDAKAIRKYARSKRSVNIDENDRLQLTKEFCLEVLDNVQALMRNLFELARQRLASMSLAGVASVLPCK